MALGTILSMTIIVPFDCMYLCIHQISVISDLKSDMIADTLEWIKQRARIKAAVGTAASQTARPTATIRYMALVRI